MTELLCRPAAVRAGPDGTPVAIRTGAGWRSVVATTNRWMVETDWWRAPLRREYRRCITGEGECLDLYRDLETGEWWLVRRYD